jgi:hypothetical protein
MSLGSAEVFLRPEAIDPTALPSEAAAVKGLILEGK